tara:strand:- start:2192 stop:2590 length:399 start_codon:yes stop_codon:yes gene_type:complete
MIKAPKFPLRFLEKRFFENVQSDKELIQFHIRNILLTNPGEKISDPLYGVGLRIMLFENATDDLLSRWSGKIKDQVAKYMPYIEVQKINASSDLEGNKVTFQIAYTIKGDTLLQELEIEIASNDTALSPLAY